LFFVQLRIALPQRWLDSTEHARGERRPMQPVTLYQLKTGDLVRLGSGLGFRVWRQHLDGAHAATEHSPPDMA